MTDKTRVIPKKNYLVFLTITIIVVLLCVLATTVIINYRNNQIKTSYLSRTIGEVQFDDLDTAFIEQGSNAFLYISYTNSQEVYNLEVKLKKIIVNNNLQDNVLYLNATKLMNNNDYISSLNSKLGLTGNLVIKYLPSIIYFKDNKAIDIITSPSDKLMINDGDFSQLLEKYEIIN